MLAGGDKSKGAMFKVVTIILIFFSCEGQSYLASLPSQKGYYSPVKLGQSARLRQNCVASELPDLVPESIVQKQSVNSDKDMAVKSKKDSLLLRLTSLLSPGEGQSYGNRAALHAANTKRNLSDPQMWTHIFFVINGFIAFQNKLYDLFLLTLITAPLSFMYHYSYEKPGKLAQFEGTAAKALFTYGLVQILRAPTAFLTFTESLMLSLTVIIFVATNLKPKLYESYHCFMHIIPPIWATIVALTHTPLLKII